MPVLEEYKNKYQELSHLSTDELFNQVILFHSIKLAQFDKKSSCHNHL